MKYLCLMLLLCLGLHGFSNPVYNKLCEINHCWAKQKNIAAIHFPENAPATNKEWIQLHLSLVEAQLRSNNTARLTTVQKQNRLQCLNYLHQYWQAGKFPQNEDYVYRTPIFIDKHDNFCAVGYLVKTSGHEGVSRKIAAQSNLAYVCDMKYPELLAWAKEYGFTVDELAWIQPTYYPNAHLDTIGKGTDGSVKELFADSAAQRLYIGGSFTNVDSTITVNNIAYITEANGIYTWHNMGTGTNGFVDAIATYNNKVFAAGAFTIAGGTLVDHIAYWDGIGWQNAGCINGLIKDLVVFNGSLYACGHFDVCTPSALVSFAKWTGSGWQGISGLSGTVNTMQVRDSFLFLGGAFIYNGNSTNVIKWNPNTGFQTFASVIFNEVNDFEIYQDTVYAVCKYTNGNSSLFKKLYGNTWMAGSNVSFSSNGTLTYNAACALADTFIIGGDFYQTPMGMGYYISNSISASHNPYLAFDYFMADGAINKMIVFKNSIFVGGDFHTSWGNNDGIGRMNTGFKFYPFTAKAFSSVPICNSALVMAYAVASFGIPPYKYLWSTGDTTATINVPAGAYTVVVTDASYNKDTATVTVKTVVIDTMLVQNGDTLSVKTNGGSYRWLNCDNNTIMPGDTLGLLTVKKNGSYAAIIKIGDCIDTTNCYAVVPSNVKDMSTSAAMQVYPNPANGVLNIRFDKQVADITITVKDLYGRVIITFDKQAAGDHTSIDITTLAVGLYMLEVKGDGIPYQGKFLKN